VETNTGGAGQVVVAGRARDYRVDPDRTHLLIGVLKMPAASCSLFHHHAVAALSVNYTFNLDRDNAAASTLQADVAAAGLDPDRDTYREAFPETAGSSVPENERRDIRTNLLGQLDAPHHPVLTFKAHGLSSLDGDVTATVDVELRGQASTLTLTGTARWEGERLVMEGTGTLDGTRHGIPNGNFSDCVNAAMTLRMHIELVPGTGNTVGDADASVAPYVQQNFPDDHACASVGFQTRDPVTLRTVEQTLRVSCGACHGEPTQYTAGVPLHTWQDFHVDSALRPGIPLFQDALARLAETGGLKMPPAPHTLGAGEDALLRSWLQSGAHRYKCDTNGDPRPEIAEPPAVATCESGIQWTRGDHGSPLMHPGMDCIGCHTAEQEGPEFSVAGTVMLGLHDGDDCNGGYPASVTDLRVVVRGLDGTEWPLRVNSAGNFYLDAQVELPYTALVRNLVTGAERHMVGSQVEGSCNACHTANGTGGYANALNPPFGRILSPGP